MSEIKLKPAGLFFASELNRVNEQMSSSAHTKDSNSKLLYSTSREIFRMRGGKSCLIYTSTRIAVKDESGAGGSKE
jgi:hypothetical protein